MRCPGAVRFHTSFRAAHQLGGIRDVQFLPVTHQECLALTSWEFCYLKLNDFNELLSLELLGRGALPFGPWFDLQRFEGIEIVFLAVPSGPEGAEQHSPGRAHLLAAVVVPEGRVALEVLVVRVTLQKPFVRLLMLAMVPRVILEIAGTRVQVAVRETVVVEETPDIGVLPMVLITSSLEMPVPPVMVLGEVPLEVPGAQGEMLTDPAPVRLILMYSVLI